MVSVLDKFEAKILAIEDSCDLTMLSVVNLISKLQAQGKENFLLAVIAIKPIILKKIVGSKINNFYIVIIALRMVMLRAIVVPSKTKQTNNLHTKQIVQKIKRKIQNICLLLLMLIIKKIWFH